MNPQNVAARTKADGGIGLQIRVLEKPYTCFTLLSRQTANDILTVTLPVFLGQAFDWD